jgi:hypothetical protein
VQVTTATKRCESKLRTGSGGSAGSEKNRIVREISLEKHSTNKNRTYLTMTTTTTTLCASLAIWRAALSTRMTMMRMTTTSPPPRSSSVRLTSAAMTGNLSDALRRFELVRIETYLCRRVRSCNNRDSNYSNSIHQASNRTTFVHVPARVESDFAVTLICISDDAT